MSAMLISFVSLLSRRSRARCELLTAGAVALGVAPPAADSADAAVAGVPAAEPWAALPGVGACFSVRDSGRGGSDADSGAPSSGGRVASSVPVGSVRVWSVAAVLAEPRADCVVRSRLPLGTTADTPTPTAFFPCGKGIIGSGTGVELSRGDRRWGSSSPVAPVATAGGVANVCACLCCCCWIFSLYISLLSPAAMLCSSLSSSLKSLYACERASPISHQDDKNGIARARAPACLVGADLEKVLVKSCRWLTRTHGNVGGLRQHVERCGRARRRRAHRAARKGAVAGACVRSVSTRGAGGAGASSASGVGRSHRIASRGLLLQPSVPHLRAHTTRSRAKTGGEVGLSRADRGARLTMGSLA